MFGKEEEELLFGWGEEVVCSNCLEKQRQELKNLILFLFGQSCKILCRLIKPYSFPHSGRNKIIVVNFYNILKLHVLSDRLKIINQLI